MNLKIVKALFFLGLFSPSISTATTNHTKSLALLINQRLSYMKAVAYYKAKNHLSIEDLIQEEKVLRNSARHAEKIGLDSESVKKFIQAQMNSAKAIQYRYRADWLSLTEKNVPLLPIDQVRSRIDRLNTKIISEIGETLTTGREFTEETMFKSILSEIHLKDSDKDCIWLALKKINVKK